MAELSKAGKEELALALILWRDFRAGGKFDMDVVLQMLKFAKHLGIEEELNAMIPKVPPMRIEARNA